MAWATFSSVVEHKKKKKNCEKLWRKIAILQKSNNQIAEQLWEPSHYDKEVLVPF